MKKSKGSWGYDSIEAKGRKAIKSCLLRKIIYKKPVNKKALREAIDELWKINEGLNLIEVGRDLWLFSFVSDMEKHIMDMEP